MSENFDLILAKILADPKYQKNILYGQPRPGHPEGSVERHIADLEHNLQLLKRRGISSLIESKLRFLIHVHDTFKAEAELGVPILHPLNHATLAREYGAVYTQDQEVLTILQFHDLNYELWTNYCKHGSYQVATLQAAIAGLASVDLLLMFTIIDGRTPGKDFQKLHWFIREVRKLRSTYVDESWIDPL